MNAAPPRGTLRPAVFVDRDDTLLETSITTAAHAVPGDLFDPALVRLLPGVAAALASLKTAGYRIIIFTSQGGIARGSGTVADCEAVNDALRAELETQTGAARLIDAVYFCPFHPRGTVAPFNREHPWRKPLPGMIEAAASELGLDTVRSWAIGDKPRDVESAVAAGIPRGRALLVGTSGEVGAAHADFPAAAAFIAATNA